MHLSEMANLMPKVYKQLEKVRKLLETHYRDMQDMEFTVEEGTLYMLQTRVGKRTPTATFKIAVDMAKEGLITKEEAIERIKSEDIERLFYPVIDPSVPKGELAKRKMATGINAVPGAAAGKAVFTAEEAEAMAQKGRKSYSGPARNQPGGRGRNVRRAGIVTATGGKTSHAAVVARGWGKCCIVGCEELDIDYEKKIAQADGRIIREGDWMTLDGNEGVVYEGEVKLSTPELPDAFSTLMGWADGIRKLGVRTNADTPHDARKGARDGRRGHRAVPHRAHVLQGFRAAGEERRAAAGHPGNDHRGFSRGAAQGAGQAAAITSDAILLGFSRPWTDFR